MSVDQLIGIIVFALAGGISAFFVHRQTAKASAGQKAAAADQAQKVDDLQAQKTEEQAADKAKAQAADDFATVLEPTEEDAKRLLEKLRGGQ